MCLRLQPPRTLDHIEEGDVRSRDSQINDSSCTKFSRKLAVGWNSSYRSRSSFVAVLVSGYAYKNLRAWPTLAERGSLTLSLSLYSASCPASSSKKPYNLSVWHWINFNGVSVTHGIWNYKTPLRFGILNGALIRTVEGCRVMDNIIPQHARPRTVFHFSIV
jgi:hypothetical protein